MFARIHLLIAVLLLAACSQSVQPASAQNVTVIGPVSPGNCAVFNSNTVIKDFGSPCGGGGGGGVSSINSSDSSLIFSPTTGNVNGTINVNHTNVWTIFQEINTSGSPLPTPQTGTVLQLGANGGTTAELDAFSNPGRIACLRAEGTPAAPTAVANGQAVCNYAGGGFDGSTWSVGGNFRWIAAPSGSTWTNTDHGTQLGLNLTATGTTTTLTSAIIFAAPTTSAAVQQIGIPGSAQGQLNFANTTSGVISVQPPSSGALSNTVNTLQAVNDFFVYRASTDQLSNKTLLGPTAIAFGSDATGDIWYRNVSGNMTRLGIGTGGQILTVSGGLPAWAPAPAGLIITTVFVRVGGSGGSDSNDCLAATVGGGHGPCLTVQHALNVLLSADNNTVCASTSTVDIGAGTFVGAQLVGSYRGAVCGAIPGNAISFSGAGSGSTTINDTQSQCGAFVLSGNVSVQFTKMTITKTAGCGGGGSDIFAQNMANVYIQSDIILGAAGSARVHAEGLAHVENNLGFTITGTAAFTFNFTGGASIEIDPVTPTITCSSANDTTAFAGGSQNGTLYISTVAFSGCSGFTGAQYNIFSGAQVLATGAGTVPGVAANNSIRTNAWVDPPTAPTCSVTGAGGGATCALETGSSNWWGTILITAGTTPSNNGLITLNFAGNIAANIAVCTTALMNGAGGSAGSWNQLGQTTQQDAHINAIFVQWNNNGSNLVSPDVYQVTYVCGGR